MKRYFQEYFILSVFVIIAVTLLVTSYFFLSFNKRTWPFQDGGLIHSYFKKEDYKLDAYWANEIKKGGYVLHLRHAQREKWDTVTAYDAHEIINKIDARNSSFYKATCLTERGIEDAKLIGIVFKKSELPIGKIISSPSCRSHETAKYAFERVDEYDSSILHATAINPAEWDIMAKRYKKLLLNNKFEKKNLVISGHGNTLDKYYAKIFNKKNLPPKREIADISETGFHVLKVENDEIYYLHKFHNLRDFAMHIFSFKGIK